jgi:hypothetical protein
MLGLTAFRQSRVRVHSWVGLNTAPQCPQLSRRIQDHSRYTNCAGAATRCSDRAIRARLGRRSRRLTPAQPNFPSMSHGRTEEAYPVFQEFAAGSNRHILGACRGRHRAAHAFDRARNAYATCRRAPRVSAKPLQSADWSDARRPTTQCSPALPTGVPPKETGQAYTTRRARRRLTRFQEQRDSCLMVS